MLDLWLSLVVSTVAVVLAWLLASFGGPVLGVEPVYNFVGPIVMFCYRVYFEARGRRTYAQRWMWLKVIELKRAPQSEDQNVLGIADKTGSPGDSQHPDYDANSSGESPQQVKWVPAIIRNCYLLIMVLSAFGLPHVPEVLMGILLIFVIISGRHPFDYTALRAVIIAPPEMDTV